MIGFQAEAGALASTNDGAATRIIEIEDSFAVGQSTSWLEGTTDFSQGPVSVRNLGQHGDQEGHVDSGVGQRQVVDIGLIYLDILHAGSPCLISQEGEHSRLDVNCLNQTHRPVAP